MKMEKKGKAPEKTMLCEGLGRQELILLSMIFLKSSDEKIKFEDIFEKIYQLFPELISFPNKLSLPDSRKIDRPLRILRSKNLIEGKPKKGFSLTKKGETRAKELAKHARQAKLL